MSLSIPYGMLFLRGIWHILSKGFFTNIVDSSEFKSVKCLVYSQTKVRDQRPWSLKHKQQWIIEADTDQCLIDYKML